MKNEKILIVGGYGKVGRVISTALAKLFENKVVVAGRNFQKAKDFSAELDNVVIPKELDIESFSQNESEFKDVKLVIMCIEQKNTRFVEWCFRQGIHYIDISATYEFLSKIESLTSKAIKSGTTAVLSVGLAPGLTNLLAKVCKLRVPNVQRIDIYVRLGLGETHGDDAIRWTLNNINSNYSVMEKGVLKQAGSFVGGKQTIFPDEERKRMLYRFNFSDQHTIPKTLLINSASTWLCLDSSVVTRLLYLFRKTGLSKILNIELLQNIFLKTIKMFSYGSEKFAVKVSAGVNFHEGDIYECSLIGNGEAHIAGLVAARVAEQLYTSSFSPGVFHIEELFEPFDFIKSLDGYEFKEHWIENAEGLFLPAA